MTVCIAAMCTYSGMSHIIGASDRMLTAGDIEFEPPQTKIYGLGVATVALVAGDAAAQATICDKTNREIMRDGVTYVRDAAEIYARHFAEFRRKRNERTFLSPLGLDVNEFLRRQPGMLASEVARLSRDLTYEELDIEGIVTGIDAHGAHIYVVRDPGVAECNDTVGFAAIGIGSNHAESQFMFAGYHPRETFEKALHLVYSAKKRAEVAPGVGLDTDIFSVSFASYTLAQQDVIDRLEEIYQTVRKGEQQAQEQAYLDVVKFVEELGAQQQQGQAIQKDPRAGEEAASEGGEPNEEAI